MRHDARTRLRIALLLAPALVVIGVLFLGGLALGLMQSFDYMPLIGHTRPTLRPYVELFSDPAFFRSLALTAWISLASTALGTVLATLCALALRHNFALKHWITLLFQLSIPVPHIVGAIAVMFLFAQSGLIARMAHALHWITEPANFPALIYDPLGVGIILEYLWKSVPFTGVILLAVLQSVGADYENVARTLGANRWQRFRLVLLPLLLPGMLRASILVFAFTFGTFEVPYLLGQTYPAVLPVLAYRNYTNVDLGARPEAMAMSMVITAIVVGLVVGYMKVTKTLGG